MMPAAPAPIPILLSALTVGAFAIGLDTFVVIGVLDEIAADLGITAREAGWIVSIYAVCYAVFAPLNALAFRRWSRRNVLVMSVGCFILGNLLCGLADGFPVMIAGRVLSAFGAAMFTPVATALATRLVAAERKGFALSLIFGGMTVSQAVGVPMATWIAEVLSWRHSFGFVVLFGMVAIVPLFLLLARLPRAAEDPQPTSGAPGRLPLPMLGLLSVTFLVVVSEFTVYAYVSVFLGDTTLNGASVLPWMLFAYGIGAIAGNVVTGVLTDRLGPTPVLVGAILVQTVLLVVLVLWRELAPVVLATGFVWGIASYMYLVPIQYRLLSHAGEASGLALAANSSLIYAGIATGALIGGVALERDGPPGLALAAAVIGTASLVAAVLFMRIPVHDTGTRQDASRAADPVPGLSPEKSGGGGVR